MKDYKEYYTTVLKSAETTGDKPRLRDYAFIKICDNGLVLLLLFLVLLFVAAGYSLAIFSSESKYITWFFDVAKLCLGVFLGLFAGKRKS